MEYNLKIYQFDITVDNNSFFIVIKAISGKN